MGVCGSTDGQRELAVGETNLDRMTQRNTVVDLTTGQDMNEALFVSDENLPHQTVYLSKLTPSYETPGSNPLDYQIFSFGNRRSNGIFMQCAAGVSVDKEFDLSEGCFESLRAGVSVNDSAHATEVGSSTGPITFTVSACEASLRGGDEPQWETLFTSRPILNRNDGYDIRIEVKNKAKIRLSCRCEGSPQDAHAIWIDPRLTLEPNADGLSDLPAETYFPPPDVATLHHTGIMEKKGDDGIFSSFSERFFVLDAHLLRWFENNEAYQKNAEEKGSLHLNDVIAIHQTKTKAKEISLEVPGRTYELKCPSAEDAAIWVALFATIRNMEDLSLRRSVDEKNPEQFRNYFKVHAVNPEDKTLTSTELEFNDDTGVSCKYWDSKTFAAKDIHRFFPMPGGNGNQFALVMYDYKLFEGASQVQLEMIKQSISTLKGDRAKPEVNRQIQVFKHISLDLFEDQAEYLAKGGYGKVYKVKEKETGEYYALKVIEAGRKFDKQFVDDSIKEKEVLVGVSCGCPFLVNLHSVWHENLNVFFCLELAEAGDLTNVMSQFRHQKQMLPNDLAGFYFAEVINVLRFLHARGIVYRDLKPENLLVTAQGHIKLTDFGLAKQGLMDQYASMTEGCTTFKGTPEYFAPEVLQAGRNKGTYGLAADWWAAGILFFEMQAGLYTTPFPSGDRSRAHLESMYTAIQNRRFAWANPIPTWAAKLPKMRSLIEGLLVKDPTKRLGTAKRTGINACSGDSIKSHDYFKEELPKLLKLKAPVDVDLIDKQWLTPPWVPTIADSNRRRFENLSQFRGAKHDPRLEGVGHWEDSSAGAAGEEHLNGEAFLSMMGYK